MANIAVLDYEAQAASTSYGKIISVTGILYNDQFQELDHLLSNLNCKQAYLFQHNLFQVCQLRYHKKC